MSYTNNQVIQSVYTRYYGKGLRGALALPQNNVYYFDQAPTNDTQTLTPGMSVFWNANGEWQVPIDGTEALASSHVLSFELSDLNTLLPTPVNNQASTIQYAPDSQFVKASPEGVFWLNVGVIVQKGQRLIYDPVNDYYIVNASGVGTFRLLIIALEAGDPAQPQTEIIPCRIKQIA